MPKRDYKTSDRRFLSHENLHDYLTTPFHPNWTALISIDRFLNSGISNWSLIWFLCSFCMPNTSISFSIITCPIFRNFDITRFPNQWWEITNILSIRLYSKPYPSTMTIIRPISTQRILATDINPKILPTRSR